MLISTWREREDQEERPCLLAYVSGEENLIVSSQCLAYSSHDIGNFLLVRHESKLFSGSPERLGLDRVDEWGSDC